MLPPPPPDLLHGAALFLDFDGTLVEIAERPDAIVVDPALPRLLPALSDVLGGRLAIVSGRAVDEIVHYLALDPATPGIAVAGSHGAERLAADGTRHRPAPPAAVAATRATLEAGARDIDGVLVEAKPYGVALHYRLAPAAQAACEALAAATARAYGLELQRGKMVYELRLAGIDKGDAVRALLTAMLAPARPVFVGDDLTDEAGFAAAQALGGTGVLVGARMPSVARCALPGVPDVIAWLATETKRQMND